MLYRRLGKYNRLLIAVALSGLFIFGSSALSANEVLMPDINNDSVVNVFDVVLVKKHIDGLELLTAEQIIKADLNGDGVVDERDYRMILMFALELGNLESLPISSVDNITINVSRGTEYKDINFPARVSVLLFDRSTREVSVQWEQVSIPVYNPNLPNSYTFKGALINLPSGVANPNNIFATAIVIIPAQAGSSPPESVYNSN